jgi:hypothetical protein
MRLMIRGVLLTATILATACGGGSAEPSPGPSTVTVTITNGVASPRTFTVPRGGQVIFTNNDTVVHEMYSDPHPEHTDCPEFDSVGRLAPNVTRQTTNLSTARTCGFHDHLNPNTSGLRGSVTIQ